MKHYLKQMKHFSPTYFFIDTDNNVRITIYDGCIQSDNTTDQWYETLVETKEVEIISREEFEGYYITEVGKLNNNCRFI